MPSDDTGSLGGLEQHIERQRRAKATHLAVWLETADPWCRGCRVAIRRNTFGEWVDAERRSRYCQAPGFKGRHVDHRPDPWTPARVASLDRAERRRAATLAGVREPSPETWALVVDLFTALYARRHPGP